MDLERAIDAAFAPAQAAVDAGRIPAAVLGVVTDDGAPAVRWTGHAALVPAREPASRESVFDLASLTKVIFTTTAVLRLVDEGRIALDDKLTKAIPDLRQYDVDGAAERKLTFRQCLAHHTHLPAVEPIYTYGDDPERLKAFVLQREWRAGPPVYSDINFILLGIAIERLTGKKLRDQHLPHGLTFNPDPALCAATEACTWRGRVMRGEVHDENAFSLGGVGGHAGLFGTIDGVLGFARDVLAGRALSAAGLAAIRTRVHAERTIGWQIAHAGWSGGDACSPDTIGHTGFTGTGLWIDYSRGLAWSLLTNRVHPSRHDETGIVALRRATGERLIAALAV
jgi:CubicO group peptidase (beta-lactamase class C family)